MREQVAEILDKLGLDGIKAAILSDIEPYIALQPFAVSSEAVIPVGASKIGGQPDLPPDFRLAEAGDYRFIAQINLDALDEFELPVEGQGILYFFLNTTGQSVYHFSGDPDQLERQTRLTGPDGKAYQPQQVLPAMMLLTRQAWALPNVDWLMATYDLDRLFLREYSPLEMQNFLEASPHRLFGYPDIVKDEPCVSDSRLLLQLDTDEELGIQFKQDGTLYYCIPDDALATGQWQAAKAILQY